MSLFGCHYWWWTKMDWSHKPCVLKKLIKFCRIFYKLRTSLPLKVLKQVYFAFVHSHISYAVEIYANTHKAYLDKLIKLNNKLLWIIQNKPRKTHLTELYENYSTLPVLLLYQQNLILFAHKILHCPQKLPDLFRHYLNKNDDIQTYNTRLKDSIHLYRTKTDFGKRSLKYRAAKFYNDLPEEIKFDLDDSGRYNRSVLRNYLLNIEHCFH